MTSSFDVDRIRRHPYSSASYSSLCCSKHHYGHERCSRTTQQAHRRRGRHLEPFSIAWWGIENVGTGAARFLGFFWRTHGRRARGSKGGEGKQYDWNGGDEERRGWERGRVGRVVGGWVFGLQLGNIYAQWRFSLSSVTFRGVFLPLCLSFFFLP